MGRFCSPNFSSKTAADWSIVGALSSSLEAVAFKSDLTDHYLTANQAMGGGRIYE